MWIEIFRSGKHTDASGKTSEFPPETIQKMVDKYNQKTESSASYEAPLVKGHPRNNAPAEGWIEKLARRGNRLYAKVKDTRNEIVEAVRENRFRKVSVSLYPDLMLRHVGLLGAAAPAVKGMRNVELSEEDNYKELSIDVKDKKDTDAGVKTNDHSESLKKENNELRRKLEEIQKDRRRKEFKEFAESIQTGSNGDILPPAKVDELTEILEKAAKADLYFEEKAEGSSGLKQKIMSFLENYETVSTGAALEGSNIQTEIQDPEGKYDPDRFRMHQKALEIQHKNPELSYEEAVIEAQTFFINK